MAFGQWLQSTRPLLASFLAITLVLAGALGWLSWRLLEQDRELEQQRIRDRLETAADVAAGVVADSFSDLQDEVMRLAALPDSDLASALRQRTDDGLIAVLNRQGVDAYPAFPLPCYPFVAPSAIPPEGTFTAGEILEFQQRDYLRAAAVFRDLAAGDTPVIRGGALLRLARSLRKAEQTEEALAVYDQLAELNDPRQRRGLISVSPSKGQVNSRLKAADSPTACSAAPDAAPPLPGAECIAARLLRPTPPSKRNSLEPRNARPCNCASVPESSGQSKSRSSP